MRLLLLILLTATSTQCWVSGALADDGKIDNRHFAKSMERTERYLKQGNKIPDTALGHYEILYNAAQAMKIRMSLLGENDERTGERQYTFSFTLSQATAPKSRLQMKEKLTFGANLLLRSGMFSNSLTSPAYNEATDVTFEYRRGKVLMKTKMQRTTGTNKSEKENEFPIRDPGHPEWAHRLPKSLAFAFATICVKAPRGERMGVQFFTTDAQLNRAIFRRTGRSKTFKLGEEALPCIEIAVLMERGTRDDTVEQRYYVDPLGRVLHTESREDRINAIGKVTKFTPAKPPKEAAVAGARKKLEADDWMVEAKKQLAKGKHHRAWRRMTKALKADPEHAGALAFKKVLQAAVTRDFKKLKPSHEDYKKDVGELFKTQEELDPKHPDLKKMKAILGK